MRRGSKWERAWLRLNADLNHGAVVEQVMLILLLMLMLGIGAAYILVMPDSGPGGGYGERIEAGVDQRPGR